MKKLFPILVWLLFNSGVFAQHKTALPVVTPDSLLTILDIEKYTGVCIDSSGMFNQHAIPDSVFSGLSDFPFRNKLPVRLLNKPLYLKFSLANKTRSSREYCFYPGMFFNEIETFRLSATGQLEKLSNTGSSTGFIRLRLNPGQTNNYLVRLSLSKSEFARIKAVLINPDYQKQFIEDLSKTLSDKKIASYILSGVLLMMILFTLVNFFLYYKSEFLYHSFFSICMFFLIFLSSYLSKRPGWFSSLFLSYLDLVLLITGIIFYVIFIRKFLDTARRHLLLDKILKAEAWILGVSLLLFTYVHFRTDDYHLETIIENSMKIFAMLTGLVFIIISLGSKDKLMKYLALGNAAQIFFSAISLLIILSGTGSTTILKSALFYFELGIIMTIFFFLLGLTYKNRTELVENIKEQEAMKMDAEKKAFETKLAVINAQQEERNRISADMHDDLGAGMTSIRLFSELAKARMGETVMPELEKISISADELLNKMNAIIWSMSSSNDSFGNMVAYIRSYALEYFENTGIRCSIIIPDELPEIVVSGKIRRNVFLVVKEALNNAVKHSGATAITITLNKEPKGFSLLIHDNGRGIDMQALSQFGNGLKNMKKRMEDVGIEFHIENRDGTLIRLYREISAENLTDLS